jgi:hypothetical protein
MRAFKFDAALQRHPEIAPRPVSIRGLQETFDPVPRTSVGALLRAMGPFIEQDAFAFHNGFPITGEIAARYLKFATREAIEEVAALGTERYADVLSSLSIPVPVPLVPDISLPAELISEVVSAVGPRILGELLDSVTDPTDSVYGRCGGMAFAAYDFYLQGWPVDGFGTTIPPEDSPLDEYILDRLLDSLDLNVRTFLEWTMILYVLPEVDEFATATLLAAAGSFAFPIGTAIGAFIGSQVDIFDLGGPDILLDRTKAEWQAIKRKLDDEAAWPVGVIFGNKQSPFDQHQILAVGYEDTGLDSGTVIVWDNRDRTGKQRPMHLNFQGDELTESGLDGEVKGVFLEEYVPRKPPLGLKL